jgi:hypothetical protein
MSKFPLLLLAGLTAVHLGRSFANESDAFSIPLSPDQWAFAADTTGRAEDARLLITSSVRSAWASPVGRWPVSKNLAVRIEAAAEGGNLIAQAEWFDRAGQLVSAEEIVRFSGPEIRTQGAPLTAPEGAADFGLKFWLEGDPAKATISALHLERAPSWSAELNVVHRVTPQNTKIEADAGLTVDATGPSWGFVLAEGTSYASAHLDSATAARPGLRVQLPVMEIPPGSSVSLQVLKWGSGRVFLGDLEAFKDIGEAGDYEFIIPESVTATDPKPAEFTVKVWINAPPGKTVRLGAPAYAEAPAQP